MPEPPLRTTRVGVFGKGGAGKSTVVVLLARALHQHGYSVVVLDADSSNIGLHRGFGLARAPMPLLGYFGGTVFNGGRVTCPVDDPTPLPGAALTVQALLEDYYQESPDRIGLVVAGKFAGAGPGAGCDGPVAKIARDVSITSETDDVVTLLDLKAGLEDSARGVITTVDQAIVVVDPTLAAVELAVQLKTMIEQIRAGLPPATAHLQNPELEALARKSFRDARIRRLLVVLNRIRGPQMERELRRMLANRGLMVSAVIEDDPQIATAWLQGSGLQATAATEAMQRLVAALESDAVLHTTA